MKNLIPALLMVLFGGCSNHNENTVFNYTEVSDIPLEKTQDGFLLIGLFTHQRIDARGDAEILWSKVFSFSAVRQEMNQPSERGEIQVDLDHNAIRLNTNLVSWWVKSESDFTDFDFLKAPVPENSLNVIAQKTNSEEGVLEVMTVNYYLGDRQKLLEIKREYQNSES